MTGFKLDILLHLSSVIRHLLSELMRAEITTIVEEIKQSIGLLRRHL